MIRCEILCQLSCASKLFASLGVDFHESDSTSHNSQRLKECELAQKLRDPEEWLCYQRMYHSPISLVPNAVLQRSRHKSPGDSGRARLPSEFSGRNEPRLRYRSSRGRHQGAFRRFENSFTTVAKQPDLTRSTGARTGCPSRCRSCYCQPYKPARSSSDEALVGLTPRALPARWTTCICQALRPPAVAGQ